MSPRHGAAHRFYVTGSIHMWSQSRSIYVCHAAANFKQSSSVQYNLLITSVMLYFRASPTNVFVNKGCSNWDNMESALADLSQRSRFMTSQLGEPGHQRLVIEHIFHSVFGESNCDLPTLRRALQVSES